MSQILNSIKNPSGLGGLPCPCCPPSLAPDSLLNIPTPPPLIPPTPNISSSEAEDKTGIKGAAKSNEENLSTSSASDLFSASVSELRRKAQEHSAALWQLAQTVQQQNSSKDDAAADAEESKEEEDEEDEDKGEEKGTAK